MAARAKRYSFANSPQGAGSPGSPLSGVTMEDLEKLDKMMLVVAAIGMFINLTQLIVSNSHAWATTSALHDGQLFSAHLSLDTVQFGPADDTNRDNAFFCNNQHSCKLSDLCKAEEDTSKYEQTGLLKNTPPDAWCKFEDAGATTTQLLTFGLLLGLVATGITAMYASQSIPWVAMQFDKIEEMGFSDHIQKTIMCACWVALWLIIFASMAMYAMSIPDSLGWGTVGLETSFGLLRLCFVLSSFNGALMVNSLYHGEEDLPDDVKFVWRDFSTAKCFSTRKVLYMLLATQLLCYFLMMVIELEWSVLLIVLAAYYLVTNDKTFMVMYVVLIIISILLDSIRAAKMPHPDHMAPGERYGSGLWIAVFALKPAVLLTIIAQEKFETRDEHNKEWSTFDAECAQRGRIAH